jgi:hypothetical protein
MPIFLYLAGSGMIIFYSSIYTCPDTLWFYSFFLFQQFKPVVKNQEEEKPQNKGSKKKVDKGANKLGAAQAAS